MNNNKCSSCGYTFKASEEKCPYCGSSNPSFKPILDNVLNKLNFNKTSNEFETNSNTSTNNTSTNNGINVCVLIILVIFFWPAAIIYAIVKSNKK